jgi:hypothetical protein
MSTINPRGILSRIIETPRTGKTALEKKRK